MTFTDDDLKRLKEMLDPKDNRILVGWQVEEWRALLARLEAAEAYVECARHLLEALLSYKKYIPEPYKQNPIYIMGSTEAEEEYKQVSKAWRKVCGK